MFNVKTRYDKKPKPACLGGSLLSGMSLIEVLVALLVLAIGCMAALNMQTKAMQGSALSYEATVATFLAESQAEWLQTQSLNQLRFLSSAPELYSLNGMPCSWLDNVKPDYERSRCENKGLRLVTNVVSGTPTTLTAEVVITVSWDGVNGLDSISYYTLVADLSFQ